MTSLLLLLLVVGLVGNALSMAQVVPGWPAVVFPWGGLVVAAALLYWARVRQRFSWNELGLGGKGLISGIALGSGAGLAAVAIAALVLSFPPLLGAPVSYAWASSASEDELLWRILVTLPIDTVLGEEVIFRGVLLAVLCRHALMPLAVGLSSVSFTLWHPAIILATLSETSVAETPLFFNLSLLVAHLAVLAAGLLFCMLRLLAGHLCAPMAALWIANAGILLVLRMNAGAGA